jgi:hypothetical protein
VPIPTELLSRARRRPALLAAGATALALAAAGCGGGGASGDEDADPASIAPRATAVYLTGFVRPQGEDREAVETIVRKVTGRSDAGAELERLVNRAFAGSDTKLTYEEDIEPWLGRRAAVAVSRFTANSGGAFIVASKDNDKARDTVEKIARGERGARDRTYKGVEYKVDTDATKSETPAMGVVGDFVVAGTETEFRAVVDASKGQSLEDNAQYSRVAGDADEKLGFGFVDVRGVLNAASAARPDIPSSVLQQVFGTQSLQPVTMELEAQPSRVTLEARAQVVRGAPRTGVGNLVSTLPGDSWLAFGAGDVGRALSQAIRQAASGGVGEGLVKTLRSQLRQRTGLDLDRDILAALGDVGFFVRGSSLLQLGGGVVISTPDPSAARRLVAGIGRIVRQQGAGSVRVSDTTVGGGSGIAISGVGPTGAINLVVRGRKLVAAYGEAATREALSPSRQLGNSPAYQQASSSLGGARPALFADFGPIAALAGALGGADGREAQRYLRAFTTAAVGARTEGNRQVARIVVNLK